MNKSLMLYMQIREAMTEKPFLKNMEMNEEEMLNFLESENWKKLAEMLLAETNDKGRFSVKKVVAISESSLMRIGGVHCTDWLNHAYQYVLGRLFPEKQTISDDEADKYARGRLFLLQLLRALHKYEQNYLPFDPTLDMMFLSQEEIIKGGYNQEYLRFIRLSKMNYVYEFMRIGIEITPFNTLGHIAGVHYVAMHAAYQLDRLKVPVDLGLVSGAAASHDIGKYGCKKGEERRIPYLHYYYTDICLNRLNMPMIAHIAANHSTWDLELENLSVESLLLIYADFRVKSGRLANGEEIVHFYSLADSFQVILDKLDNVDEAKELRYRKVYNKLKDFEEYMINLGVNVNLPEKPAPRSNSPKPAPKKDISLLRNNQVVKEFKYQAVDHNIRLMNKFYQEEEFSSLLETARSETKWKNLRTYISILGEYSTYMTEKQKQLTLRFLIELLVHRESDIRNQAGEIIGQLIARFNEEYKKELPAGVNLPEKKITNMSLWEETLENILIPDYKLTDQHKKWMENCLKSVVLGLLNNCSEKMQSKYIDALLKWYKKDELTFQNKEALLRTAVVISPESCQPKQIAEFVAFAERIFEEEDAGLKVASIGVKYHYDKEGSRTKYRRELKKCLGLDPSEKLSKEVLSEMYRDNLKARTPWPIKIANIELMLQSLDEHVEEGQALHVATHLGNLVKVSETVTVRKGAGDALISIIDSMPLEQRNEIAVELGKGLEIGDYQFSKYIPNYLGVIMLHLPPRELDELISDLEKFLEATNEQVASAVLHTFGVVMENYKVYRTLFGNEETWEATENRKYKLVNLIVRGFANYNNIISQEALWAIGMHIFGSDKLDLTDKYQIFSHCGKKVLTLYNSRRERELDFFNNAAVLNQIYRFICQYELEAGNFNIPDINKIAFFPGTFDPFSLSHKAIATEIRDLGYEVYLALDEFSWSKKTQPRLQRRRILNMSVADEENIYVFPDDIPVNIANPKDLARLKEIFKGKELYFVAGSDVIENASCYRAEPVENSIHSMNHIVFKRSSDEKRDGAAGRKRYPVTGNIINLHLEEYYEDISSTRIRENIDSNRDISNLIDPVAQNYIFDRGLYLREPAYKYILQARDIKLEEYGSRGSEIIKDIEEELLKHEYDIDVISAYLNREDINTVVIRDGAQEDCIVAVAAVNRLDSIDLLNTFGDQDIAAYIRSKAAGAIAVIGGLYFSQKSKIAGLGQTILVEVLSELLARDYTYVVYHPCDVSGLKERTIKIIEKQGFVNIAPKETRPIYAVDMRSPVIVFKNVDTIVKSPLSKNKKVLKAVEEAHNRLLAVLTSIYPGEVILSYNSSIMHHKIIQLITRLNGVSPVPSVEKNYGPYMVVPFGKVLEGVAVPNTVTKALHTEKYFSKDASNFTIEESSFYSTIQNQVKTIKSFNRPVILVDDLLHKGYRMKEIDPILKENQVEVVDTVVGVQTGRGRDLMTIKERSVDSAYFLPNLKCWLDETAIYPYIGGDSMKNKDVTVESQVRIPSLNLVLPYAVPTFFGNEISGKNLYDYSMTCLENARDILKALEEEYQNEFEQKLTLKRIGEVITDPKRPDVGENVKYDENVAASAYVERDIERLTRMRKMFK